MKRKRLKTSCGIVASFGYYQNKNGEWCITSCGTLKRGRSSIPTAFAPIELYDAVIKAPRFKDENSLIAYLERV